MTKVKVRIIGFSGWVEMGLIKSEIWYEDAEGKNNRLVLAEGDKIEVIEEEENDESKHNHKQSHIPCEK